MSTQQSNGNNTMLQGRLVWTLGQKLSEGKLKLDDTTKQPVIDPKTGEKIIEYGFGLAIPKIDPRTGQPTAEYQRVWQLLHTEAFTLYPSGQLPPDFAMKYKDGDTSIDEKGQPYSKREGYPNHLVLGCTTRIPFKMFRFEGGNNILVNDGIKNGDYVNVQLNIKAHPAVGRGKPGLYLNPSAIQLIQAGKEIINTPSGDQMFGMAAPVYNGQVEAPVYTIMPQQAPMMPQQAPMMPQGAPMPGNYNQAPAMSQQAPVAPHYDILPPNHQPAQQAPVMPGNYNQAPMMTPPMGNGVPPVQQGQMQYGQQAYPNTSAQPAYPSNGVPPMPGMPR